MQFHEYRTLRNQVLAFSHAELKEMGYVDAIKQKSSAEYRDLMYSSCSQSSGTSGRKDHDWATMMAALGESIWVDEQRPYYRIWPVAVDIARRVKLTIPFKHATVPGESLLFQFAHGHEPLDIRVAMLTWAKTEHGGAIFLAIYIGTDWNRLTLHHSFGQDDQVENFLERVQGGREVTLEKTGDISELLIRLIVFVGLLANDHELVTPIVLSKDRNRYEASDTDVKQMIEERAVRKLGRGFDVGKKLQFERDTTPHWRNPHLALYWTGPRRTKPIIKMRSGSVVQGKVSMALVPTGYLGPETEADDRLPDEKTPRVVSAKMRFEILKRDSYRCRICGRGESDGVKLHVDHVVPLAKGGSNSEGNLQTTCSDCNLGKGVQDA